MANINLLPWRDARREELKRQFLSILALVALGAVLLLFLGDRVVNSQIDAQKARNDYLSANIRELDAKVEEIRDLQRKRNQLLERMRVIQELQGNRPVIVRIFDQLVRTLPDGVFYTEVTAKGRELSITGVAESNNRVSSLMRQLDASAWLENPNLESVRAATAFGDQAATFDLKVMVSLPNETADTGAGG
jgi:type IV pilus assembly protein PilN